MSSLLGCGEINKSLYRRIEVVKVKNEWFLITLKKLRNANHKFTLPNTEFSWLRPIQISLKSDKRKTSQGVPSQGVYLKYHFFRYILYILYYEYFILYRTRASK